jgi:glycosyltransferase involved in cell wall biosynthesis
MPKVSVIMPVYNVERFVKQAVQSVLAQSFSDFELIIVDDVSPDASVAICASFGDARIRIVRHRENGGLANARNTGIRHARGEYIAFLDSDDVWRPEKLALHVRHLESRPEVGLSFSRSEFLSPEGTAIDYFQMPRLEDISAGHMLRRNPVGNGSAPVIRRATLDDIEFSVMRNGNGESCWFDERFRQSEDIECWVRICATTEWKVEGIPQPLTLYRLNAGGLSANLLKQLASWDQMITKIRAYAPGLLVDHERPARAYQLRYLARQAIRLKDGTMAVQLVNRALGTYPALLRDEPGRTLATAVAAYLMWIMPRRMYSRIERIAQACIGRYQKYRICRDRRPYAVPDLAK